MLSAITGAQSVGKTTLLQSLNKHGHRSQGEITRVLASKGFKINESGTDETQIAILQAHIEREQTMSDIILDRCMLDGLVYTKYLFEEGQVQEQTLIKYLDVFEQSIKKYDKIFYIRPEFNLVDDGARSTNVKFRDRIVELFDEYIEEFNVPVIVITGTVQERTNQIIKELNE